MRIALVAVLFVGGAISSLAVLYWMEPRSSPGNEPVHSAEPVPQLEPSLVEIDEAMEAGDDRLAVRLAEELHTQSSGKYQTQVRYRLALGQEAAGEMAAALAGFKDITPELPIAGTLGRVRCLARSKHAAEALALLDVLMHIATTEKSTIPGLREEVLCWRAAVMCLQSAAPGEPLNGDRVRTADFILPPKTYLHWSNTPSLSSELGAKLLALPSNSESGVIHDYSWHQKRTALEQAISEAPKHPLGSTLRLELANRWAEDGKTAQAVAEYEQLLARDEESGTLRRLADFNLGRLLLHGGEWSRARAAFLRVIDRTSGDELEETAWWMTVRTFLDAGDTTGAIKFLHSGPTPSQRSRRSAIALGVCAAYLLEERDEEAHAALARAPRGTLGSEPFGTEAALLDALARYRIARRTRPRPVGETEDLLWALASRKPMNMLGPAGELLCGLAYREVGLAERMAVHLERALRRARGPLATRMAEALVDHKIAMGNDKEARSLLLALAYGDDTTAAAAAALRLARHSLESGDAAQCLQWCQRVTPPNDELRTEWLLLLGRAYELLGNPTRAAESYAGIPPHSTGPRD